MEPNVKLSFLSKLQTLDEIQTGNGYTTIEIIGNENEEGKRYVKKTIFLNNQNAHYAYMQRTMMQIIDSEYVLKLLQWEQISQTNRTASKIKQMQTAKPGIPKKLVLYMDYCQKGDLKRHLIQENPQIQTRIQIFLDILYAMRFLHQKFIIHRDMKLENIFITHDHQIKIADLGFASQTLSLAQTKIGTFGEEAPEVFIEAQEGYSDKVDVWSIGYLGFQILNKPCEFQVFKKEFIRDPYLPKEKLKRKVIEFGNQNMKEFYFKIFQSNFLFFTPQVPKSLKYLISQMLKPDPAKRISFRQIYSSKYLQNLREELGGQKVQKMKNFPSLEKDYQQIYSAIQINKKQIHQNERIYSQLYQKIYEPLVQKIFQQNSLKLTTNQEANDLLKVFYLTMRRMKAIYKEISDKKLINMKKKFQQCDKKVSQKIIPVRNSLELYLKSQGKHPIQSNQDLLSADYFENLLKKVSINHNLNVQAIIK